MKRLTLLIALLFTVALSYAQKPALDHSVYDSWNTLRAVSLPHNGDIMMYTITPGEGDVTLVIENIRTGKKFEVTREELSQSGCDDVDVALIDGFSHIKRDLVVIPSYIAKGLEFDATIIYTDKINRYKDNCNEENKKEIENLFKVRRITKVNCSYNYDCNSSCVLFKIYSIFIYNILLDTYSYYFNTCNCIQLYN